MTVLDIIMHARSVDLLWASTIITKP